VIGMNPNCYYGDHDWLGGGVCLACGKRLRCGCGQFVTEDGLEKHIEVCPQTLAFLRDERRQLEATHG
jgi:hypothetical protein